MLTDNREIVYLAVPGQSTVDDAPAPISFAQPPVEDQRVQYATFGTFMANQRTENKEVAQRSGPLIVGRGAHNAVNAVSFTLERERWEVFGNVYATVEVCLQFVERIFVFHFYCCFESRRNL